MTFKFSQLSLKKFDGVHPELRRTVTRALTVSDTDFCVFEGMRSIARQKALVASGASKTINSRHLTGHAVDLVPWLGGLRWDWPLCYRVASAMRLAAIECDVNIVWGGVWDRPLHTLSEDLESEVAGYISRKKPAFTDGPHFELNRKVYP
jgi:peptidoglycan L-alanyl-D-glutamate endopeptidase CwlK